MGRAQDMKRDWTINGSARSTGGSFNKVTVRGEGVVSGDLECELLKVMGTFKVTGNMSFESSKIMGTIDVGGDVRANELSVMGELSVLGDCNAESFKSKGTFDVCGMLNAGNIEIQLYGDSSAREIGGDSIVVKPHFKWFGGGFRQLTVDTLEGDTIRLEHTKARVVRGNHVEIGPNCEIETVEYQSTVRIDASSKVTEQIKR
jgi:cytoskeletal protein CcmA (bactofilin family)